MISTTRYGITYDYLPRYTPVKIGGVWSRFDSKRPAGVRMIYSDGTKRWISNNWYDKQDIQML